MTHRASNFTEGVLEMERTVLGIIQVDARQILHDGLRKELVRQVSRAMHATLVFVNPKTNTASSTQVDVRTDLDRCLKKLGKVMDGFRRSVEYLQVYYISDFVACMQLVFVNSTEESVLFFLLFFLSPIFLRENISSFFSVIIFIIVYVYYIRTTWIWRA